MNHRPASGLQGLRKQRKVCMPRKDFWKRRKVRWPWHQMAGQQCWPPQLAVILLDQQLNQLLNHQQLVHHGLIYRKAHPLSWRAIGRQQLEKLWKTCLKEKPCKRAKGAPVEKASCTKQGVFKTEQWVFKRWCKRWARCYPPTICEIGWWQGTKLYPTHARWPRWL